MAITNYLVHFKTSATFEANKEQLRNDAIAFVGDATIIHTHGTDYYCGSSPVALESDLVNYATTSALTSGLASKANVSHTHSISQISGLQEELDSKLESVSLADLGVTATATELNYVDGVTSNIQTQLNNKAASSHEHAASAITSGTLSLDRLPSITDAKITSISASKITGTIPQTNLPSYVDDVLEYSSKSAFPNTGEAGKIYVDTTTNLTYRWGGSSYVEISPSLALGETSSTAYRGDRGKIAYDHSQATGNPHSLTLSNLGISATAAELNYMDGVTSNVQTQLNGKAANSHTHTASQVSGLATVATSGSYNDLSNKPSIPSLAGYATQSWVQSQGYLTSVPAQSWSSITGKPSTFTPSAHTHSASDITSGTLSISRVPTGTSSSTVALGNHTHSAATTYAAGFMSAADKAKLDGIAASADSVSVSRNYISGIEIATITVNQNSTTICIPPNTNTAGTYPTASKLFLIGGTSQSSDLNTGVVTYSNSEVYTWSGQLYASQMNATNGFYETSDARLKNFKDDVKALDVISEIPTKYFIWKEDKNQKLQIGTSAQEVEKLYPELISKTEDDILTVDYAKLSIVALAAIKELKAEIQSLKEEIKQLKSK